MSQINSNCDNSVNDDTRPTFAGNSTTSDSLAVRENLYFGIPVNHDDDDESDENDCDDLDGYFTSVDVDDNEYEYEDEDEPQQAPPVTPQRIAELIGRLDSAVFHNRDATQPPGRIQAQALLEAIGPAALPQLIEAAGNPNGSAEQRRRADLAIDHIARRMTVDQLMELRNPETRNRLINANVRGALDQAATDRVVSGLEAASVAGMSEHLAPPPFVAAMRLIGKNKLGDMMNVPTEETVRQWDRMTTPQGQQDVAARLQRLAQMLGTGRLNANERQAIAQQITELGSYSNPESIEWGRVNARTGLAEALLPNSNLPGNADRIRQLMLEAHQMQAADHRAGTIKQIVNMGLDQDPAFMQALARQGGRDAVIAVEQQRQQMALVQRLGNMGNK